LSPNLITEGAVSSVQQVAHDTVGQQPVMKSRKGPGNVFDRHLRIDSVLAQEVDAVSPEALQHLLDDLADVVGPGCRTPGDAGPQL
jgi:hypothetical protein